MQLAKPWRFQITLTPMDETDAWALCVAFAAAERKDDPAAAAEPKRCHLPSKKNKDGSQHIPVAAATAAPA